MEGIFICFTGEQVFIGEKFLVPGNKIKMNCGGVEREFAFHLPDEEGNGGCHYVGAPPQPGDKLRIDGRPAVKVENLSRPDTGSKVADAAAKGFHGTNDPRAD